MLFNKVNVILSSLGSTTLLNSPHPVKNNDINNIKLSVADGDIYATVTATRIDESRREQ